MPIEIKELHIRVNITSPATPQTGNGLSAETGRRVGISGREKQELIAECVEQVMIILENKKER